MTLAVKAGCALVLKSPSGSMAPSLATITLVTSKTLFLVIPIKRLPFIRDSGFCH